MIKQACKNLRLFTVLTVVPISGKSAGIFTAEMSIDETASHCLTSHEGISFTTYPMKLSNELAISPSYKFQAAT